MDTPRIIPDQFARIIVELYEDEGVAWLDCLPSLLAACEQRWSLTALAPFPNLTYNYVAPAIRADGSRIVLKVGVPNDELTSEIEALRIYARRGAVQLLDADPDEGIVLLEQLMPGTLLSDLPDDEAATTIAAQVMRRLWRPVPRQHAFPTVARWGSGTPAPARRVWRRRRTVSGPAGRAGRNALRRVAGLGCRAGAPPRRLAPPEHSGG